MKRKREGAAPSGAPDKKRSAPRLFKVPEPRTFEGDAEIREWCRGLVRESKRWTLEANIQHCAAGADEILADPAAHDEAKRLARETMVKIRKVREHLQRGADSKVMLAGMVLGTTFALMKCSESYARAVDERRRVMAALEARMIAPAMLREIRAWWSAHRDEYRSDNAARLACAIQLKIKSTSTVRTAIETD